MKDGGWWWFVETETFVSFFSLSSWDSANNVMLFFLVFADGKSW